MNGELRSLAERRFGVFSAAESQLLDAISNGNVADCSQMVWADKAARSVRADLIRWLCVDTVARNCVDVRGINLQHAIILGRLDLAFTSIRFPISLLSCDIAKGIDLTEAEVRAIMLDGSHCGSIAAVQLHMQGSLYMRDGFVANGEVRLQGAVISGGLECRNARFENPGGDSLSANGLRTSGSVYLDQGFYSLGTVRLTAATIERSLVCSGGRFVNCGGVALVADGANIKASILMEQGFVAAGEVRLMGAMINGDLSCRAGRILNHREDALSADGINVGGAVNLNRGFRAIGRVRFVGAHIRRDLTCRDSQFLNVGADALVVDRAYIDGNFFLEGKFRSNGLISMRATRVGGDVHVWGASFRGKSHNGVWAESAHIAGKWIWKNVNRVASTELNLAHAQIGQLADEKESWPAKGKLYLNGLVYGSISAGPTDAEARIRWLQLQPAQPFYLQPYEQMAGVLRRMGNDADAVDVSIAGQDARLAHGGLRFAAWWRQWAMKYLLDYGFKPHYRALIMGAIIIGIGAGLFHMGGVNGLMSPTRERVYMDGKYLRTQIVPEDYPDYNSLVYSIDAFMPFVDLHQEEFWLPNANRYCRVNGHSLPCGAWLRAYHWFQIGMGWVLATLFAVGLTGLVKKE
ncbi:MAG: hypothetical protein OEW58_12870 [Gammaproteobacteria bacterium]|nr:hypothetical protein [Gammaproteobacteria bacterium]